MFILILIFDVNICIFLILFLLLFSSNYPCLLSIFSFPVFSNVVWHNFNIALPYSSSIIALFFKNAIASFNVYINWLLNYVYKIIFNVN